MSCEESKVDTLEADYHCFLCCVYKLYWDVMVLKCVFGL